MPSCPRTIFAVVTNRCILFSYWFLQNYNYVYRPVPSGTADAGTGGRPLHTIRSCLQIVQTHAHRTRRNVDHLVGWSRREIDREIDLEMFGFGFVAFVIFFLNDRNRPNYWWETENRRCCTHPRTHTHPAWVMVSSLTRIALRFCKTNAVQHKKWKNRQLSSSTELVLIGIFPLQGVCHAPHSHTSSKCVCVVSHTTGTCWSRVIYFRAIAKNGYTRSGFSH